MTSAVGTAAADAPPTSEKVNPAAPNAGAAALVTTSLGHLLLFYEDNGQVIDLTVQAGATTTGQVYSEVGVVVQGGAIFAYGTNQTGGMIEYAFLTDHLSGGALVILTPSLVVYAFQVPTLIGFTVARYET